MKSLTDLIERIEKLTSDTENRSMTLHWSDVVTLRLLHAELVEKTARVITLEAALSRAIAEIASAPKPKTAEEILRGAMTPLEIKEAKTRIGLPHPGLGMGGRAMDLIGGIIPHVQGPAAVPGYERSTPWDGRAAGVAFHGPVPAAGILIDDQGR